MENSKLSTLVLGASPNRMRYSNLAVQSLRRHGYPVIAVGKRDGQISDVDIIKEIPEKASVDTVTLYMNANNQRQYYDAILALAPKRIIFNPGAENHELVTKAEAHNIKTLNACTLVMLSTGQY